jgi:pimeloyl-ACP methyl ester carboxylesterase
MNTNHSSPKTKFVDAGEISLGYLEWPGDGGPLICLPSITGHKGSFTVLAHRLAPKYRVLALDLRGRGESDKPKEGYGFAYHARDVFGLADSLQLETFSLIGHSYGATTAVYLASIQPDRIRSLVLIDGGADPKAETLQLMRQGIRQLDKTYPSMTDYLERQRSVSYYKPWTQALETYLREDVDVQPDSSVRSRSSAKALELDLDIHFYYSMCLHFPNIKCPVLFLRPQQGLLGSTGHIYSDVEATNIVRHIPNCRRENVRGGNHYTMLIQDNPPVYPFIDEFLGQVSRKPGAERASQS